MVVSNRVVGGEGDGEEATVVGEEEVRASRGDSEVGGITKVTGAEKFITSLSCMKCPKSWSLESMTYLGRSETCLTGTDLWERFTLGGTYMNNHGDRNKAGPRQTNRAPRYKEVKAQRNFLSSIANGPIVIGTACMAHPA